MKKQEMMEGKQTRQVGAMQWLLAKANCVVSTVTSPVTSMCTRALLLADAVVENVRSKESQVLDQARQAEAGWRVRNTSLKFVVALKAVFVSIYSRVSRMSIVLESLLLGANRSKQPWRWWRSRPKACAQAAAAGVCDRSVSGIRQRDWAQPGSTFALRIADTAEGASIWGSAEPVTSFPLPDASAGMGPSDSADEAADMQSHQHQDCGIDSHADMSGHGLLPPSLAETYSVLSVTGADTESLEEAELLLRTPAFDLTQALPEEEQEGDRDAGDGEAVKAEVEREPLQASSSGHRWREEETASPLPPPSPLFDSPPLRALCNAEDLFSGTSDATTASAIEDDLPATMPQAQAPQASIAALAVPKLQLNFLDSGLSFSPGESARERAPPAP